MPIRFRMGAAFYFWKIYNLKKGKERDQKLGGIFPYIAPSNFIFTFFTILALVTVGYPLFNTSVLVVSGLLTIIVYAIQSYIQTIICELAILRNTDQWITKEELVELGKFVASTAITGFVFLSSFATLKLINELENIFSELADNDFNKINNQEEIYQNNSSQEENYQEEAFQNGNYQDEKVSSYMADIESIFYKYNIPLEADESFIIKRFRALAKEYHPDSPTGDAERFKEIWKDKQRFVEILKANQAA